MRFSRWLVLLSSMGALLAFIPTALATPGGANGQAAKKAVVITSAPAWTPAEQALTPERDWINVGGNIQQQHYSKLNQINAGNVGALKEAWHIHLDGSGTAAKYRNEATPLVYAGVMYIPTGNNDVFALDAATGQRLWTHLANEPQNMNTICCGWDARGLAIGEGMVFSAQLDGTLVALSQQDGGLVWATKNARWQDGYTMTMAPRSYSGAIVIVYPSCQRAFFVAHTRPPSCWLSATSVPSSCAENTMPSPIASPRASQPQQIVFMFCGSFARCVHSL